MSAYFQSWLRQQDKGDAPEYVEISHRVGVVKRGRKCSCCGALMPAGTRFEARAYKLDGEFRSDVECVRIGDEWECPLRIAGPTGPETGTPTRRKEPE